MKKGFKRMTSLALAAFMAIPAGICAYADDAQGSEELKATLAMVKSRIDIPKECTKFSYEVGKRGFINGYGFTWQTPDDAEKYRAIYVSAYGSVIISYDEISSDRYADRDSKLAEMSKDELYKAAQNAVKKLDPTVYKKISIDKDSLSMSVRGSDAYFAVQRTENGVPVENDSGSVGINKDTGELISFRIGWHPKASFQKPDKAVSVETARESYEDMIALEPMYTISYDYETKEWTAKLVYSQTYYGEITAFSGKKNDFATDGYFDDNGALTEEASADMAVPETGAVSHGVEFTKEELAELNKELPYSTEDAIKKLVQDNPYLTWSDDFVLESSRLSKGGTEDKPEYTYYVSFSNESKEDYWEEPIYETEPIGDDKPDTLAAAGYEQPYIYKYMSISVNAETGNVENYSYGYSGMKESGKYDFEAAKKKAADVADSLAPDIIKEYTERNDNENSYLNDKNEKLCYGSDHSFIRTANGIKVSGNNISVSFNADMTLTYYSNRYTDVQFPDPKDMLSADEVMDVFWETHDFDMYYLVRTGKSVTLSTLVYGTDVDVYADAFTGKQVYDWSGNKYDISGIKDKELKKTAQILLDNGLELTRGKLDENADVNFSDFSRIVNMFSSSRIYVNNEYPGKNGDEVMLTTGEAMRLLVKAEFGKKFADLNGIFKSPFDNIKDSDPDAGVYAAAWAMGAVDKSLKTLDTDKPYTYADLINLCYSQLS